MYTAHPLNPIPLSLSSTTGERPDIFPTKRQVEKDSLFTSPRYVNAPLVDKDSLFTSPRYVHTHIYVYICVYVHIHIYLYEGAPSSSWLAIWVNVNRLVNPLVREVGDEDICIYISLERTSPRVWAIEFINRPDQPTQNFALSWRKQATDDVNSESFSVVSILVNGSCVLKARACREGLADSDIATSGLFDVSLRFHTKLVSSVGLFYRSLLQVSFVWILQVSFEWMVVASGFCIGFIWSIDI